MTTFTQVWKYGGGTQSVTIAALILAGRIPKPDIAVIADTGRERKTTWQYLDTVVAPALATVGIEIHRVRASEWAYGKARSLELFSGNGDIIIPAFTNQTGEVGKMSGFCNGRWKQDTVNHWLSQTRGISKKSVRSWIGFSADEYPRIVKMQRSKDYQEGRIWFPLPELGLRRRDGIALVEAMGWPTPPRSACYMCPNQQDAEWSDLKFNHPDEFGLACVEEVQMQKRDPNFWFHDSCKPLATVEFKRPDDPFMRACDPAKGAACFT